MPSLRSITSAAVFLALTSGAAHAQGAPMQLPKGGAPAANAISKVVPPPKVSTQDGALAIQKANAWFNANSTMVGDFVQIAADGRRTEGKLYVQKPGRLRFQYASPATIDIIADGTSVAIRDRKLATQDLAYLWQTPLKVLLKEKIDLSRDTKVMDVSTTPTATTIVIEDKATLGGTSRIKLVFDPKTYVLKQWMVTDPQGYDTLVSLFNLDFHEKPDPELFHINMEKFN